MLNPQPECLRLVSPLQLWPFHQIRLVHFFWLLSPKSTHEFQSAAFLFFPIAQALSTHAVLAIYTCISYIFSRDLSHFSRDFTYVHWNIPTCSPIRIFIFGRRYVPILKMLLRFFKNRSFGGVEPPEGLEIVPDILTQNILEIRILTATGAGSDQPCSAGLGRAKMDEFSRES
jgi:hypothetical protein